jgi:hypothetical protein
VKGPEAGMGHSCAMKRIEDKQGVFQNIMDNGFAHSKKLF